LVGNVSGAAAVYRNLKVVFDDAHQQLDSTKKRYVICDREYTSYTLVRTLLDMGFYFVGTCMPSRLGFPSEIIWPKRNVPSRGQYNVAMNKEDHRISATAWRDSNNVYFLASGASTEKTGVIRRSKVSICLVPSNVWTMSGSRHCRLFFYVLNILHILLDNVWIS
jgi:hypothetical protein